MRVGNATTVAIEKLRNKWLSPVSVLYIGKAGSLKERLKQYMMKQYMNFSLVSSWGSMVDVVWQLEHSGSVIGINKNIAEVEVEQAVVWADLCLSVLAENTRVVSLI